MQKTKNDIEGIVEIERSKKFSDAAIRKGLQKKKFKKDEIDSALRVETDSLDALPIQFERVSEGVSAAVQLFNEVRNSLGEYVENNKNKTSTQIRNEAIRILKANPIYKSESKSIQAGLVIGLDNSLDFVSKGNATFEKKMAGIRNNLKQREIGIKELDKVKKQIKKFIVDSLVQTKKYSKKNVIDSDVFRLLRIIDATDVDTIKKESDRAFELVEKIREKQKKFLIDELAAKIKDKARSESKTDANDKSLFRKMGKLLKTIKIASDPKNKGYDQAVSDLNKLKTRLSDNFMLISKLIEEDINKENPDKIKSSSAKRKAHRDLLNDDLSFHLLQGVYEMSLEDVRKLLNEVELFSKESKAKLQESILIRDKERKIKHDEADRQIKETNPELFDDEGDVLSGGQRSDAIEKLYTRWNGLKIPKEISSWVKEFKYNSISWLAQSAANIFSSIETLTNVLDRTTQGFNTFRENIYDVLNVMHTNKLQGLREMQAKINSIAEKNNKKDYKEIKKKIARKGALELPGITTIEGKPTKSRFTADEIVHLYALSLNEDTNKTLSKMGFDKANIERMKGYLEKDVVGFVDGVVVLLSDEYFESINEVFKKVENREFSYVNQYFPLVTEYDALIDTGDLKEGEYVSVLSAESAPYFNSRTAEETDIDLTRLGFIQSLDGYIDTMEKYKAYAEGARDIKSFMNVPSVRTLVEALFVKDMLKQLIMGDISPSARNKTNTKHINKLYSQFTGFILSFRPMQVVKQATSAIVPFSNFKMKRSGKNPLPAIYEFPMFMIKLANVFFEVITKDLLGKKGPIGRFREISPDFDMRILQAISGETFGLESGRRDSKIDSVKKYKRIGVAEKNFNVAKGAYTSFGDALGIMGQAVVYDQNIKNGMDKVEALKLFNDYNSTQQPRRGSDKNILQNENNFMVRSVMLFSSTYFAQLNKVMQSYTNMTRDAAKGKSPRPQDVRSMLLNLTLANALFAASGSVLMYAYGDDDDKYKAWRKTKEALLGFNFLYQLPVLGAAAEKLDIGGKIISAAEGNEYKQKRMFSNESTNPLVEAFLKAEKLEKNKGMSQQMAYARVLAELAAGTQFDMPESLYNLYDASDRREIYEELFKLTGAAPSQIPSRYIPENRIADQEAQSRYAEEQVEPESNSRTDDGNDGTRVSTGNIRKAPPSKRSAQ